MRSHRVAFNRIPRMAHTIWNMNPFLLADDKILFPNNARNN